jgi:hypothetical protein
LLESEKLIRVDHCAKDLFWRIYFGS